MISTDGTHQKLQKKKQNDEPPAVSQTSLCSFKFPLCGQRSSVRQMPHSSQPPGPAVSLSLELQEPVGVSTLVCLFCSVCQPAHFKPLPVSHQLPKRFLKTERDRGRKPCRLHASCGSLVSDRTCMTHRTCMKRSSAAV